MLQRYGVAEFSQFTGAQMMADQYGLRREQLDSFALQSHRRAAFATKTGAFEREIFALEIAGGLHTVDEGIRADATLESIAAVRLIKEGGSLTAANASQICDGASGVLVANERALKTHALEPAGLVHQMSITAGNPVIMLEEPISATRKALERSGLSIDDIDLYEVNEAFAPIPLAWLQRLHADPDRLNVNGGAIALGHPLGASGTKLMATLVHALRARGRKLWTSDDVRRRRTRERHDCRSVIGPAACERYDRETEPIRCEGDGRLGIAAAGAVPVGSARPCADRHRGGQLARTSLPNRREPVPSSTNRTARHATAPLCKDRLRSVSAAHSSCVIGRTGYIRSATFLTSSRSACPSKRPGSAYRASISRGDQFHSVEKRLRSQRHSHGCGIDARHRRGAPAGKPTSRTARGAEARCVPGPGEGNGPCLLRPSDRSGAD